MIFMAHVVVLLAGSALVQPLLVLRWVALVSTIAGSALFMCVVVCGILPARCSTGVRVRAWRTVQLLGLVPESVMRCIERSNRQGL
jgi:hypothetical protein